MTLTFVTLGELFDVVSGGTPSRSKPDYWGGKIPWVKISDMLSDPIQSTDECISSAGLENSAGKLLPTGTLLISIFATVGRTAFLATEAATNQAIVGLIPKNRNTIDLQYCRHFLNSAVSTLKRRSRGVAQQNINTTILKELPIPLPPLPEQKRIAAILDKADAIRRKREKAIELTDSFLRSVFLEMFGDPVTNPNHWTEAPLADICEISSGITKGRRLNGKITRAVPYLRVANVQDSYLDLSEMKTIPANDGDLVRYNLLKGDMLMTEGGDPDKLGRGALWNEEIPNCVYQNHIYRVRIREEKKSILHPEFLSAIVGSRRGKLYFLREAKQTTGIATINSRQLKSFPLFLPPIELQTKYVETAHRSAQLKIRFKEFGKTTRHLKASLSQILFDPSVSHGSSYVSAAQQQEVAHAI